MQVAKRKVFRQPGEIIGRQRLQQQKDMANRAGFGRGCDVILCAGVNGSDGGDMRKGSLADEAAGRPSHPPPGALPCITASDGHARR